jgi:hypothetical protein
MAIRLMRVVILYYLLLPGIWCKKIKVIPKIDPVKIRIKSPAAASVPACGPLAR